jgi:hypothetical protein
MDLASDSITDLFKSDVDKIVDRLVGEELRPIVYKLEKYYMAHILGAGNHFAKQYGFKPIVRINREDVDNGFRICIEVKIPDYIVNDIRESVRKQVLESMKLEA